jgi:hypothetical protein
MEEEKGLLDGESERDSVRSDLEELGSAPGAISLDDFDEI